MARLEQKALDPDAQMPAFRHGVFGVQAKIYQHVLEKNRVRLGSADLPAGLNFDFDGVRNDRREEIKDSLQLLVQIDPPLLNGEIPAQRAEPGDKLGGPVGGLAEAGEMKNPGSAGFISVIASIRLAWMEVRRFPKSWAIPLARIPVLSIRSAW